MHTIRHDAQNRPLPAHCNTSTWPRGHFAPLPQELKIATETQRTSTMPQGSVNARLLEDDELLGNDGATDSEKCGTPMRREGLLGCAPFATTPKTAPSLRIATRPPGPVVISHRFHKS